MKTPDFAFLPGFLSLILLIGVSLVSHNANARFATTFPWSKPITLEETSSDSEASDTKGASPSKSNEKVTDSVTIEFSQTDAQAQFTEGNPPLSDEEQNTLTFQTWHGGEGGVDHTVIFTDPADSDSPQIPNENTDTFVAIAFALLAALEADFPEAGNLQTFVSSSHVSTQKEQRTIHISMPSTEAEAAWPEMDVFFSPLSVSTITTEFRVKYWKEGEEKNRVFKLLISLVSLTDLYTVVKNDAWYKENRRRDTDEDEDPPPPNRQIVSSTESTPEHGCLSRICGGCSGNSQTGGGGTSSVTSNDCIEKLLVDHVVEQSIKGRLYQHSSSSMVSW